MNDLDDLATTKATRDGSRPMQLPPAEMIDADSESTTDVPSRPPRRWRAVGWVAALVVLLAVAAGAWWVGASSQSPDQAAARAQEPEASWVTAPVEFRVLSATVVTRGDVQPDTSTDIVAPASVEGTAVITNRIVEPGDVVAEGDRVVEVSGRPVFVLQGDAAIYRSLQPGMEGDDIAALQAALTRLGYNVEVTGVFDDATKGAVSAFYSDAGYDPIPTSPTFAADLAAAERAVTDAEAAAQAAQAELDRANQGAAPSEIAAADAAVAAAQTTLDSARATRTEQVDAARIAVDVAKASRTETHARPDITVDEYNAANVAVHNAEIALAQAIRDNDAAVAAAQDQLEIAVLARSELDDTADTATLQTAVDTAQAAVTDATNALTELRRVNGPTVAQGEVVFVTTTPTRVLSTADTDPGAQTPTGPAADGTGADSGAALVSLASGDPVVTAWVRPDQVELIAEGLEVELLDELTDTTYQAAVTAVADNATTNPSGQLAHQITVTTDTALPDELVGTNMRVTLTAASTDTEQLVVPVAAVTSAADGTTRVNILDDTGIPVEVEVTAGLSADGFVAITPTDPTQLDTNSAVIVGR